MLRPYTPWGGESWGRSYRVSIPANAGDRGFVHTCQCVFPCGR
jgi:hypothetical protein